MAARSTRAAPCSRPRGGSTAAASRGDRHRWRAVLLVALAGAAQPAWAEFGYSLSLASDDRFRGESTSDHLPVTTLAISYDDANGPYAGVSVTVGPVRGGGVRIERSIQYAGYARRLPSGLAIDVGVTNRIYDEYASVEYARRFAQGYVGVVGRKASSHLFFAPNYDGHGEAAAYLEGEALLFERGRWSLSGHLGGLLPPARERSGRAVEVDWRLGVTRRVGRAAVNLSWVGATPDQESRRWRGTLVLSASRSF